MAELELSLDEEHVVDRFEARWRSAGRPEIEDFLPPVAADSSAEARRGLLRELVMVDLWCRWRTAKGEAKTSQEASERDAADSSHARATGQIAQPFFLEDYIRRFPELGSLDQLPPEMIAEEYRARLRWGDRPAEESFLARFPRQAEQLSPLLHAIRAELASDTSGAGTTTWNGLVSLPEEPTVRQRSLPGNIGKYHIVALLDEGGQAQVFRAVHPGLSKEVVLKLAWRSVETDHAGANCLAAESRLLAELDLPQIARIYDLDFHEGRPFLVMEYVRGRNLRQHVEHCPMAPRESAILIAAIARIIAAAHARGVIHRDIKPKNILVDEANKPWVIDFGLSQICDAWQGKDAKIGTISGTVEYMAPEQARGETDHVGPRTDVFALGAVLYFLLTGKAPFSGDNVRDALPRAQRCEFDAEALNAPHIPRKLAAICLRAMQAEPAARHGSATALAAELERFARGRRRVGQGLRIGGCLALLVLLAVAGWSIYRHVSLRPSPDQIAQRVLGHPPRHDFWTKFTIVGLVDSGTDQAVLSEGQPVAFRMEADRDCNVRVSYIDSKGQVIQLFPNLREPNDFLPAGRPRTIPGFQATASAGREYIHFVASTKEPLRGIVLTKDKSPAFAETLVPFQVKAK